MTARGMLYSDWLKHWSSSNTGKEGGIIVIGLIESEAASRIRVTSETIWLLHVRGSTIISL